MCPCCGSARYPNRYQVACSLVRRGCTAYLCSAFAAGVEPIAAKCTAPFLPLPWSLTTHKQIGHNSRVQPILVSPRCSFALVGLLARKCAEQTCCRQQCCLQRLRTSKSIVQACYWQHKTDAIITKVFPMRRDCFRSDGSATGRLLDFSVRTCPRLLATVSCSKRAEARIYRHASALCLHLAGFTSLPSRAAAQAEMSFACRPTVARRSAAARAAAQNRRHVFQGMFGASLLSAGAAHALIPDDDDEEMVNKAKANRQSRLKEVC